METKHSSTQTNKTLRKSVGDELKYMGGYAGFMHVSCQFTIRNLSMHPVRVGLQEHSITSDFYRVLSLNSGL